MNILMKLWEDSGSSLWIYKRSLKPDSVSFSQLFVIIDRSCNLPLHLACSVLKMSLAVLNRIGKGVGNVEIHNVGKIPAFVGWAYKKNLTFSAKCCNQKQISRHTKVKKQCLKSCSWYKLRLIQKNQKRQRNLQLPSISEDFQNWVLFKEH